MVILPQKFHHILRPAFIPCSHYDVEKTEAWDPQKANKKENRIKLKIYVQW